MTGPTWTAALTALPKVELGVCLEGMMRADTVRELARKNGVTAPPEGRSSSSDGERRVTTELVRSVLRTRQDWALLAYESTLDAAASGVTYRETCCSPASHLAAGGSLADIVAGIDDGLTAGERETGVVTRVICNVDRRFGRRAALEQVELVVRHRRARTHGSDRVIGVGMIGGPEVDPGEFAEAYTAARRAGLHRTARVGVRSAAAIETAIDVLGCERIDQGVAVLGNPALVTRMVTTRIPLNVTPSSHLLGVVLGEPRPAALSEMLAAGLLVAVCSAEPAITGVTLGEEYRVVSRALGLGWDSMVDLALAGAEAAWVTDDERRLLMARIERAAASLRPAA